MGKELAASLSPVRETFEEADRVLEFALSRLCFEGPEETLRLTSNTQPAIFVTSIAIWRAIESNVPVPVLAAGHSLGEYSALVASGALPFAPTLAVVRKRGLLMQESADRSGGAEAMAAVLGLDGDLVCKACVDAEAATGEIVDPANFNCPGQIVISGSKRGVEKAMELAKAAGAGKCILLNVSGAFHSRLMRGAAERFRSELANLPLARPRFPVVTNVSALPATEPQQILGALEAQVASPVRWEETIQRMVADGVDTFLEVGPGKVLSGFVKRVKKDATILNVEDSASWEKTASALKERVNG